MSEIQLNTIEEAIEDFREGKFLIVVDDEDRENEGDFIIAAEKVTPEKINFMLKNGRGVLCAPITEERCQELELDMQVANNTSLLGTPFTITVDKLGGKCTTGVSMYDRAETILALADPKTKPSDLGRPGHINPLRARSRGVHRLRTESIVENGVEVDLPTEYGHFRLIPFRQKSNGLEHIALIKGKFEKDEPILVRVHSSCATGDIFGSMRCECGEQLHEAMRRIDQEGKGVIVYLNQEGRGIGLMEKMKAYKLQEDGLDTVDANLHLGHQADERDYGVGAQILRHIGVTKMRLMSNNPVKRVGLEAYGLEVVENVPIEVKPNPYNEFYMKTKKERMGHVLHNIK